MKDFFAFIAVTAILLGLFVAVPVLGITVGLGLGLWFLWNAWKEERDANRY